MLHTYENCAYAFKLKYIDRIPEPERPLPPGKTEHANDRGTRIHDGLENFVAGEHHDYPREAEPFEELILDVRDRFSQGLVMLEHDWCFTEDWTPCQRKERDMIAKVDFAVWLVPGKHLLVGDYKTGRQYPVKHMDQMQVYSLAAFKKYPGLEQVTTELWYLDQDDIASSQFKPRAAVAIQNVFTKRVNKMRSDREHKPAAHQYACRFCSYKVDGICPFAVTAKPAAKAAKSSALTWADSWPI